MNTVGVAISNAVEYTYVCVYYVWVSIKVFYVYASVHRCSVSITVQRDATQSSVFIIMQVYSTCFGCQTHPSSGLHKTVTTASGIGNIFCAQLRS